MNSPLIHHIICLIDILNKKLENVMDKTELPLAICYSAMLALQLLDKHYALMDKSIIYCIAMSKWYIQYHIPSTSNLVFFLQFCIPGTRHVILRRPTGQQIGRMLLLIWFVRCGLRDTSSMNCSQRLWQYRCVSYITSDSYSSNLNRILWSITLTLISGLLGLPHRI